jgi:hypothetical protein
MKPGDLVRVNIAWSSQYHGKLGIVVGLGSHETADVMVSGIGMRTFDWEVLEVVNETR